MSVKSKEDLKKIPAGKPKSGRVWKTPKKRFSSMTKGKALRTTFAEKVKERNDKKALKLYEKELKDRRLKEQEEKKQRVDERRKRKLENTRKAEIVQTIHNTAKLKRMKKKQLRMIEKR